MSTMDLQARHRRTPENHHLAGDYIARLEQENEALRLNLESCHSRHDDDVNHIEILMTDQDALQSKLRNKATDNDSEIKEAQADLEKMEDALQATVKQYERQLSSLRDRNDDLRENIHQAKAALKAADSRRQHLIDTLREIIFPEEVDKGE